MQNQGRGVRSIGIRERKDHRKHQVLRIDHVLHVTGLAQSWHHLTTDQVTLSPNLNLISTLLRRVGNGGPEFRIISYIKYLS